MSRTVGNNTGIALTRRTFLLYGITFTGVAALDAKLNAGAALAAQPEAMATADFVSLSQFLTGHSSLDAGLAARALEQLRTLDTAFDHKLAALAAAIAAAGAKTMDDFLAANPEAPLRTTATTVVSAWYLGYTGTPDLSKMEDQARFVTYREALMFKPTLDVSIIPTFSRGPNGFWTEPPATIATD